MEQIIQAIGVVASVAGVLFAISNTPYTRKLRGRSKVIEDYEFLASFLAFDVTKRPRLIVEQAFAVFFGHSFRYEQINYILKFKNPSASFDHLRKSKEHLELRGGRFEWKAKKKPNKRFWLALYFVLFVGGLYPPTIRLIMQVHMDLGDSILLGVWAVSITLLSINALIKHIAIAAAEELLKEQQSSIANKKAPKDFS